MKKIILSLMTSGFDPKQNAITRILAKINQENKTLDKLIIPYNKTYETESLQINNQTEPYLSENGTELTTALFNLEKFIFYNCGSEHQNKPLLVGYNINNFDIPFLKSAGFDVDRLFKFKILDLFNIVVGLDYLGFFKKKRIVLKDHKLTTICQELNLPVTHQKTFDKIKAIEQLNEWLEKELCFD